MSASSIAAQQNLIECCPADITRCGTTGQKALQVAIEAIKALNPPSTLLCDPSAERFTITNSRQIEPSALKKVLSQESPWQLQVQKERDPEGNLMLTLVPIMSARAKRLEKQAQQSTENLKLLLARLAASKVKQRG
ncbi:MAG: hypothetical protein HY069_00435 [Chlamydiia bacterium]|nr:hypothetical protein [Chlamydiia bacterium]